MCPLSGSRYAVNYPYKRRFARPISAKQSENATFGHIYAYIIESRVIGKGFHHVMYFKNIVHKNVILFVANL